MYASFDFTRRIVPATSSAFVVPAPSAFLLDSVSQAATGAYSTRKLRSAYGGACMNVRSGLGGITFQDIGFLGNGELDTASLLSFLAGNDGYVNIWYDQSGNGFNQSTTANLEPQITSGGSVITSINGTPSLLFDGSNDKMTYGVGTLATFLSASQYALCALVRPTSGSGTPANSDVPCIFGDQSGSGGFFDSGFTTTAFAASHFDSGGMKTASVAATYPNIYVAIQRYNSTNILGYLNGGTGASTAAGSIITMTNPSGLGSTFTDAYFAGTMGEVILFNVNPSDADINIIGNSQATRGGVTWTNI